MLQIDDTFQNAGFDVFDFCVDVGEDVRKFCDRLDGVVVRMFLIVCRQCCDACGEFVVYRLRYLFIFADESIAIGFELANAFDERLAFPNMLIVLAKLCLPS